MVNRELEEGISAKELLDKVKIMIGGAPVTQSYAGEISADGYASNIAAAAELAKNLSV